MTDTPSMNSIETNNWYYEQQRWIKQEDEHLSFRLGAAITTLQHHHTDINFLKKHLRSALVLLNRVRSRDDLSLLAIDLINILHPWPSRWGYWTEWESEIRFAISTAAAINQPQIQAELLNNLAKMLFHTGRLDEAIAIAYQAMIYARAAQSVLSLISAGSTVGAALRSQGKSLQFGQLLKELASDPLMESSTGTMRIRADAHLQLQRVIFLRYEQRVSEALCLSDAIIISLETLVEQDLHLLALAYRDRGVLRWAQSDYTRAAQDLQQAMDIFINESNVFDQAFTTSQLGLIYWSLGDLEKAESSMRRTISITKHLNALERLNYEIGHLGLVYLSRGYLGQALTHFEHQIAIASPIGDVTNLNNARGNRGIVRLHLGDYINAKQDLEDDLQFVLSHANQEQAVCNYVNLSRCYAKLGQIEKARSVAQDTLIHAENGSIAMHIISLRCLAEYESPPTQYHLLSRALDLARQCHRKSDQAACLLVLGQLPYVDNQTAYWNEGITILETIGAHGWLDTIFQDVPVQLPLVC